MSRDDWLFCGLEVLRDSGVRSVKIDHLAHSLGVAKTGFYWHFKNRAELLKAMLAYWEREYTGVLVDNSLLATQPAKERLLTISQNIADYRLNEFDPAISAWARHDADVAALLEHTYAVRMVSIKAAFRELGFRGDELEMRTRLFVCYHLNEDAMFGPQIDSKAKRLRRLRVRLLTQKLQ